MDEFVKRWKCLITWKLSCMDHITRLSQPPPAIILLFGLKAIEPIPLKWVSLASGTYSPSPTCSRHTSYSFFRFQTKTWLSWHPTAKRGSWSPSLLLHRKMLTGPLCSLSFISGWLLPGFQMQTRLSLEQLARNWPVGSHVICLTWSL